MNSTSNANNYPYNKVTIGSKGRLGFANGINLNKIGTGNTMPKNIKQNNMYDNKPYSIKK
jgi:hypothetical protein